MGHIKIYIFSKLNNIKIRRLVILFLEMRQIIQKYTKQKVPLVKNYEI